MKRLRLSVISLILGISLFLMGERLNFALPASPVKFETFIYPFGLAAIVAVLAIPVFTRMRLAYTLLLWVGVYLILKLALMSTRPVLGGVYTYLTLAEAALISLMVIMAYIVGRTLVDYMHAVDFITWASGGSSIPNLEQAIERVEAEINRSRHYNRSLSVILASLETNEVQVQMPRFVAESQEQLMHAYLTSRLADTLRSELRRMDIVVEDRDKHRVIIISPEVDDWGAGVVKNRLTDTVARQMGIQVQCGVASFPEKALTFEDLVREAELDLNQNGYHRYPETQGVIE